MVDEVAEIPVATQAKLLRFLAEGTYFTVGSSSPSSADVRVIAATNAPLLQLTESGTFRRDLYYRLAVLSLHLPPLRDRTQDIVPLARLFLSSTGPWTEEPETSHRSPRRGSARSAGYQVIAGGAGKRKCVGRKTYRARISRSDGRAPLGHLKS